MLLIKLLNSYPALNEDGTAKKVKGTNKNLIMFRYTVHGSKEELEHYKECQGGNNPEGHKDNHYRESEEGVPLYFTSRPIGKSGQLGISTKGNVFIDTTDMDLAEALINSHGSAGVLKAKEILGMTTAGAPQVTRQQIDQSTESLD